MSKKYEIKNILENPKFVKMAVAVCLVAIALIFASSYIDLIPDKTIDYSSNYSEALEERLLSIVSDIDGVGDVKIFLTMDNSGENMYLENSDTKTKTVTPTVRGIVIVCDGGDDPVIINRVTEAVTKSLDIPFSKVCVTKLSEYMEDKK